MKFLLASHELLSFQSKTTRLKFGLWSQSLYTNHFFQSSVEICADKKTLNRLVTMQENYRYYGSILFYITFLFFFHELTYLVYLIFFLTDTNGL